MSGSDTETLGWHDTLRIFLHPRVVTMLFLGFSAGIPILLIFPPCHCGSGRPVSSALR